VNCCDDIRLSSGFDRKILRNRVYAEKIKLLFQAVILCAELEFTTFICRQKANKDFQKFSRVPGRLVPTAETKFYSGRNTLLLATAKRLCELHASSKK